MHERSFKNISSSANQKPLTNSEFDALSLADKCNHVCWLKGKVELELDRLTAIQCSNMIQYAKVS